MTTPRTSRCNRPLAQLAAVGLVLAVGFSTAHARAIRPHAGRTNAHSQDAPAKRPLALTDYYGLETAGSPAISPDGRLVAFVRTFILEAENRRHSEIWLAPTDGSTPPRRLTHPSFGSSDPQWSPDGKLLAFRSSRRGPGSADKDEFGIWFLRTDPAGGEAFQIPGVRGRPIFSPDNDWIAFTSPVPPRQRQAPPPEPEWERLIHERFKGRIYDWMSFRFDQRGYLPDPRDPWATPPEELFIVSREGGTPRLLTTLGVDVQEAVWRPDSGALAIIADTHQRDEYTYERSDVWVVGLDSQTRRLTDDGYNYDSPTWSPDGRAVVVRRAQSLSQVIQSRQNHGSPVDLCRLAADGGAPANLTADWDLIPESPFWSADGQSLYFTAGAGGTSHLFRLALQSGTIAPLTQGARHLESFSFSAAGDHMAYTATDSARPPEVFSARMDGSGEIKLSSLNDPLVAAVGLSQAQRITYPSKDGTSIEGWVLLPPGYATSKGPYPLILSIHGGPHGAYGETFSFQFQWWAANGYLVLYTNPRGSTGYGEKFLWATWGGWGILDYDDVIAGVDYVVGHYAIDQKRLGVTGYSYGGFLTNWIIGHTPRFQAAIVGAGISNWMSDYGTADIPRTKESEFYGPPWDGASNILMTQLSPITYVSHVSTPTLFVHGESDLRVPIEQGEQMYTALKKRRIPARFIRYPDSYHGGWSPWNTLHRYYAELNWWNEHLR